MSVSLPVVVVIATHARTTLLDRTLSSLTAAARPDTYRALHLVENGEPSDGTAAVAARHASALGLQHRRFPSRNKSLALNALLDDLGDELLIFLDDDVRVAQDALVAYAEAAAAYPERAFYGGPLSVDYEVPPPEWLRRYLPRSAAGWEWQGPGVHVCEPLFLGGNWAIRARDLKALGGFDGNFGPGAVTGATGQESMMQRRLLAHGYTGIYVPRGRVWHYVPRRNCTQRWALRRAFRNGVGEGLRADLPVGPRVFGAPRWMVRQLAGKSASTALSQLSRSPDDRFAAVYDLMWAAGKLQGLRLASARAAS